MNEQATRDHREINQDLPVFVTHPLAGAGLPVWLPDGAVIREELQRLARDLARADGCQGVYSPVLGKRALYERSGHWAKFSDDMFPPVPVGGDELVLRPANCPHHALIYASVRRSYRELPIRRVVMIHRGIVGSMERVTAALLEHYQGRLPLWLAWEPGCVLAASVVTVSSRLSAMPRSRPAAFRSPMSRAASRAR